MNPSGDQPVLTRDQLMELVADGQRALGQGRADEALMVAESVIESDDLLPAAWALKGDALERQGRLPEALASYERVIELKPDSALDRIRANHLRKLASVDELEVPTAAPNRRQAAMAAVAATVFFVLVGSAVVLASQPQSNAAAAVNEPEVAGQANDVDSTFNVPPVPNPAVGSQVPPNPAAANSSVDDSIPPGLVTRGPMGGSTGSSGLPLPGQMNGPDEAEVAPFTPNVQIAPTGPERPAVNPPQQDPNPAPVFDPPVTEQPKKGGGVVIITPSGNSGGTGGSALPPTNDSQANLSAEALVQAARDHYIRGDYAKAAAAYEKALRAGAQASSTNHRLGLCYKQLGRKADAIAALERAVSAYQAEIDRGAEPEVARAGISACQQAIKTLKGG